MGPGGQNVIIEQENGPPVLTKDGVTVARAVNLSSRFENMGVQIVKEAASKTAETAGDGTTTATILTQALVTGGQKLMAGRPQSQSSCVKELEMPPLRQLARFCKRLVSMSSSDA